MAQAHIYMYIVSHGNVADDFGVAGVCSGSNHLWHCCNLSVAVTYSQPEQNMC